MRPRGTNILLSSSESSFAVGDLNHAEGKFNALNLVVFEFWDLDFILGFEHGEIFVIVREKVLNVFIVDFKETHLNFEVCVFLQIPYNIIEGLVANSQFVFSSENGMGFAGAGDSVGEDGGVVAVKEVVEVLLLKRGIL